MKAVLIAAALLSPLAAMSAGFELKGMRVAMSEKDLVAAFPKARCSNAQRPTDDAPGAKIRVCSLPAMTLADEPTESARAKFYDGKLGAIDVTMTEAARGRIAAALARKFGEPAKHSRPGGYAWSLDDARMVLVPLATSQTGLLMVTSPLSDDHDAAVSAVKKRKADTDL